MGSLGEKFAVAETILYGYAPKAFGAKEMYGCFNGPDLLIGFKTFDEKKRFLVDRLADSATRAVKKILGIAGEDAEVVNLADGDKDAIVEIKDRMLAELSLLSADLRGLFSGEVSDFDKKEAGGRDEVEAQLDPEIEENIRIMLVYVAEQVLKSLNETKMFEGAEGLLGEANLSTGGSAEARSRVYNLTKKAVGRFAPTHKKIAVLTNSVVRQVGEANVEVDDQLRAEVVAYAEQVRAGFCPEESWGHTQLISDVLPLGDNLHYRKFRDYLVSKNRRVLIMGQQEEFAKVIDGPCFDLLRYCCVAKSSPDFENGLEKYVRAIAFAIKCFENGGLNPYTHEEAGA